MSGGEHGTETDGLFHYTLGRLRYDEFDKAGNISIGKLSKMLEGVRFARIGYKQSSKDFDVGMAVLYVRSHFLKMHPPFYNLTEGSSLKLISLTSHVGRTSLSVDVDAYDVATGELLATCSTHSVLVSMETGRPTPIPPKVAKEMTSSLRTVEGKRPVSGPDFPTQPSACFTQKRVVFSGDTDVNEHLNHAVFIDFCLDCTSMAAMQGKLPSFVHDTAFSNIKTLWVQYIREAAAGEELTLSCWESEDLKCVIWVEVCREFLVIGQCQVQFYVNKLMNDLTSKSEGAPIASKL